MTEPEYLTREQIITGLRNMANWLERHPDLAAAPFIQSGDLRILAFKSDPVEFAGHAAIINGDVGGAVVDVTDDYVAVDRTFGPITYHLYTARLDKAAPIPAEELTAEEKWRAVWGPTVDALTALDAS
jgi:hypothetical protein